jgi:hypothetical protein
MKTVGDRSAWAGARHALVTGASMVASALWIAICAAAPEFIWNGFGIALHDLSRADVAAALLIGLILAFFVEPLIDRLRELLDRLAGEAAPRRAPRRPLFVAGLSLAFALVSACLHYVMTAFVSERHGVQEATKAGLAAAIDLTASWSLVPFAIALAWLCFRRGRLGIALGIIGAASPLIAGLLFSWSLQDIVDTIIPCLLILGLGYAGLPRGVPRRAFARCAAIVAGVAVAWLATALILDATGVTSGLYDTAGFWVDLRFYGGWIIGLLLAPFPQDTADEPAAMPAPSPTATEV